MTSIIRDIFKGQYKDCICPETSDLPYNWNKKNDSEAYSVDCIYEKSKNQHTSGGKRCDEFIFYDIDHDASGLYLVERKDNKSNDVEKVRKQLQGGACFINSFLKEESAFEGAKAKFNFLPVLVSKEMPKSSMTQLKQHKIVLHGAERYILYYQRKASSKKKTKLQPIDSNSLITVKKQKLRT